MLGTIISQAKREPYKYEVIMTRGVAKGSASSPVKFNMYVNQLGTNAEAASSACLG